MNPPDDVGEVEAPFVAPFHPDSRGGMKQRIAELEAALDSMRAERDEQERIIGEYVNKHARLEARLEAAEGALRAIATGERPSDSPTWLGGRSWRIDLARDTLRAKLAGDER